MCSRASFIADQVDGTSELISWEAVRPIQEIHVPDAKALLLQYRDENRLSVTWHPNRLPGIPDDDEDLVQKAVEFDALDKIKRYHPHLVARVEKALALRM